MSLKTPWLRLRSLPTLSKFYFSACDVCSQIAAITMLSRAVSLAPEIALSTEP